MDAAGTMRALLNEAHERLRLGEPAEAERHAKAVSALVRAERDVAEYLVAQEAERPEADEDELLAEILRRLDRLAEAEAAGSPDKVLDRIAAGDAEAELEGLGPKRSIGA